MTQVHNSKKSFQEKMPLQIKILDFLHFPNELCSGYLSFEGNGKIPLWICPVGFCLSLVLLNWNSPQGRPETFFSTFLKEFSHFLQTYGSHSWVLLENSKKNLVFHFGVGRHASFSQKPVVNWVESQEYKAHGHHLKEHSLHFQGLYVSCFHRIWCWRFLTCLPQKLHFPSFSPNQYFS